MKLTNQEVTAMSIKVITTIKMMNHTLTNNNYNNHTTHRKTVG